MSEGKDHEYSMARSQLKTVTNAAKRLQKKMGKKGEGQLKAWVQSKITKAADYIDTAADYVTNEETCPICACDPCQCLEGTITEEDEAKKCPDGKYWCYTDKKCKTIPRGWHVGRGGYIEKDEDDDSKPKEGNGNGEGGNGNGGGSVSEGNKSGDNSLRDWFGKSRSSDGTPGWVQLGGKYAGKPCARQPGQTTKPKCGSSKMKRNLDKDEEKAAFRRKQRQDPNPDRKGKAINVKTEEVMTEKKGEKDACYHKVKSRYSVWPSAYASGALVKCRKVGAKNWGNKSKNESYDFYNWRDDFKALEFETIDLIKPEPLQPSQSVIDEAGKKCWKGYKKAGTQKLFGKTYNRCVKANEEKEHNIGGGNLKKLVGKAVKRIDADVDGDVDTDDMKASEMGEFIPSPDGKKRIKTKARFEEFSNWRQDLGEDWQKVNKSDKTDGMSQKAVNAYRRENPGSKLKTAVTGDPKPGSKDSKRRKSFCARSKGQQDMHNIDCSKTPDKPVCKARRRWKC